VGSERSAKRAFFLRYFVSFAFPLSKLQVFPDNTLSKEEPTRVEIDVIMPGSPEQGGTGIVLQHAAHGRDWIVCKFQSRVPNKAERINAEDLQSRGSSRWMGWKVTLT
jgi:hypothetical protein